VERRAEPEPESEEDEAEDEGDEPDAELSELDEDLDDEDDEPIERVLEEIEPEPETEIQPEHESKRKRKRKDAGDDLESRYMQKLEKEEAREAEQAALERAAKRQKSAVAEMGTVPDEESSDDGVEVEIENESDDERNAVDGADEDDEKASSPPPKHETQQQADEELSKAQRTVFLGNVSTTAITNKSNRRLLIAHLCSFFDKLPKSKDDTAAKPKLESIRFRSTPFASAIPKKAAFAKKELMDATTRSTNAYAVYHNPQLAREAARRLNATVVLDRHLRVDSIAHPAKTDHRRCVFVGNLGFVDDETNIQAANAEAGRERTRKPSKTPADNEEGLWRTFGRHGAVESVRVIRDSKTRVGIGIAYVQFVDENSVEAALLDDEKKFPPMLPRKLRVQRAKAMKRNARPGSGRPGANKEREATSGGKSGYKRKITAEEASQMGRTGKLYGKAAAASLHSKPQRRPSNGSAPRRPGSGGEGGIKAPESFVFEGHRATAKQGKTGLKFGKKGSGGGSSAKKQGKPTNRSAKRGAAFKAGGSKKRTDG